MENSEAIKRELSQALINDHRSWLWSYDMANKNLVLSDHLIIEKYLLWGKRSDWARIKQAFSLELIKDIWLNNLISSGMYEEKHIRIARYFFNIDQPVEYLKNARKKIWRIRLQGLTEKTAHVFEVISAYPELDQYYLVGRNSVSHRIKL